MRVIIILFSFLLSGCTTIKTVYVPTPCPHEKLPPELHYPIKDLKPGDKPNVVAKAWVGTVYAQQDWINLVKKRHK